jgi:hypothetical protein
MTATMATTSMTIGGQNNKQHAFLFGDSTFGQRRPTPPTMV